MVILLIGVVMFFAFKSPSVLEDGLDSGSLRGVNSQALELRENTTYTPTTIMTCNAQRCWTEFYSGRVNYWNGTGFIPIDNRIVSSSDPIYEFESTEGTFNVFFRENPDTGETIKFFYNESFLEGNNPHKSGFVTFQPLSLNYRNDLDQLQQISNVQSVTGVASEETFTYPNVYGSGINLTYNSGGDGLFKKLVIGDRTDLIDPEQFIIDGGNPTLEIDFNLGFDGTLDVFINGEIWNQAPNNPQETSGAIEFQLEGESIFELPSPTAEDSNGELTTGDYLIRRQGNSFFVQVIFDYSWLNDSLRVYPIELDPTISLSIADTENLDDTYVRSSQATTNFGSNAEIRVLNSTGGEFEILMQWNISSIPVSQQIDSATLHLVLDDNFLDGADIVNVTIRRLFHNYTCSNGGNFPWDEGCPTWNFRPNNDSQGHLGVVVNNTAISAADADGTRFAWNVTGPVRGCYAEDLLNCSFYLQSFIFAGGPSFPADRIELSAKERPMTVDDPILNITHSDIPAGATCDCPSVNTDWRIADGSQCLLTTVCNIGTGNLFIHDGRLHITSTGSLNANACYVADDNSLYADDGGGLICRA